MMNGKMNGKLCYIVDVLRAVARSLDFSEEENEKAILLNQKKIAERH
ncbi:Uncharacterised protein [Legionella maceachernii]|nr:Uncharacterised protein [Legionella maceachernii]